MKKETIVQIIARSSSKRIKDKNVQLVGGHPLIAWSIRLAKAIPSVDKVILNTDSQRYAEIGAEYGAEAPFLRPKEFAGDKSCLHDVMNHAIWSLRDLYDVGKDEEFDAKLITFYPTSPFRNVAMCEKLIAILDKYKWVSVGVEVDMPWSGFCLPDSDGLRSVGKDVWKGNGQVFYKNLGNFQGRTLKKMDRHKYLHKVTNPMECVDIDTEKDMDLMRDIVDNNLYDFGAELW